MIRNPRAQPTADMALVVRRSGLGDSRLQVVLVNRRGKTFGFLAATLQDGGSAPYLWVEYGAATDGYGPLLYDAAALIGKALGFSRMTASDDQSEEAQALWWRNKSPEGPWWDTPTRAEFAARYGVRIEALVAHGQGLNAARVEERGWHFYDRMTRHLGDD